jgi:zinc protease
MFTPDKAPERATIPATPDVATLLKDYRGGAEVAKGAAFEATYAAIEAHTQRTKLPFGMKLALLPKETRNNRVNVVMNFRYGSEQTLQGRMEAAAMMGPMLARGTQKHTRREIQDAFDALKAQVRIGQAGGFGRGRMGGGGPLGTAGVINVSIECSRESLPRVLDLVAEVLRQPGFPADEFVTLQQEALATIEEQGSEPMALAMLEVGRRMAPYPPEDVRYVATLPEQAARIRGVTVDQVKALYGQLAGASFSEVAAVGDFDSQELTQALTKHFSGWANPKPFTRIDRPFKVTAPDSVVIETPDKANALFAMGTTLELRDDDPDYPALFMANYVLGASGASRFMNRIRQKEGLSYGCGTSVQASAEDRSGSFIGFGMCAPQNAAKAMACGREELEKLLRDGVPAQELEDAKSAYRQQLEVQLSNDATVASQLAQGLYLGRTLEFNAAQQKQIESLDPADLPRTLGKHVSAGKLLFIRAGDFSAKQPSAQQASGS